MPVEKHPLPKGANISLTAIGGSGKDTRYTVNALPSYIGSGPDADILVVGPGVSESHARIVASGEGVFIEDLGTGGGTFVNERTVKRSRLENGDIIELGSVKLLLQLSMSAGWQAPAGVKRRESEAKGSGGLMAGGFSHEFRDWFISLLAPSLGVEGRAFRTGEEVLVGFSEALSEGRPPSLLFLDLKLPVINGVNVAIAARAFELGYSREDRVPIVFFFDPPDQTGFQKVVRFCQPLKVISPGDSLDAAKDKAVEISRKVVQGAE